jgi:type II secretory pathway pseudopilin PulG
MRTVASLLILVLAGLAARADDANRDTARRAARATIERQIDAFRRNDAVGAYAEAAPQIRNLFPSAETFIAMVAKGYAPVLRPRSYRFETAQETAEDEIAQGVSLQDEAGLDWVALYTLQRQVDGQWRITGCQLKKAPGERI